MVSIVINVTGSCCWCFYDFVLVMDLDWRQSLCFIIIIFLNLAMKMTYWIDWVPCDVERGFISAHFAVLDFYYFQYVQREMLSSG